MKLYLNIYSVITVSIGGVKIRQKQLSVLLVMVLAFNLVSVLVGSFAPAVHATEIFSDGFESGDFSAWTSVYDSSKIDREVSNTYSHHGNYSAHFWSIDSWGGSGDFCRKTITSQPTVFLSAYVRFSNLSGIDGHSDRYVRLIGTAGESGQYYDRPVAAGIHGTGTSGTNYFYLVWVDNGTTYEEQYTGLNAVTDTWYHLELKATISSTAGEARLYVDGTEVITKTGLNTTAWGNINEIQAGVLYMQLWDVLEFEVYIDCVVASTETTDSNAPTYSLLSYSSYTAGASCQFNVTVNDDVALHPNGQYQFGTNNTGTWVWDSAVNFASTPETVSVTKTLNSTAGLTVAFMWNFTDNAGNSSSTGIITFTLTSETTLLTVIADSGSATDIQAAVDHVVANGGEGNVRIPEGTWNFVDAGGPWQTVAVPCGVNIFGAPTERDQNGQVIEWKTVLVMPYEAPDGSTWFEYTIDEQVTFNSFRFSDVKLVGWRYYNQSSTTMYIGISVSAEYTEYPTTGIRDFRIDHCNFQDMAGSAISFITNSEHNRRPVSGVIDHNRFVNSYGDIGFMEYENRTLGYGISMRRWACDVWENDTLEVWGHYTNYTVVIEDNYFSKWRHATCSNDGIHQIVRFNTFNGSYGHGAVDGHGSRREVDGERWYAVGTRCMEVYNNTFLNYDSTWDTPWVINIRGGSALVYNNSLDGSYPYLLDLNNDWGNYDELDYCAINDTYIWDNQLNGASIIHYNKDSVQDVNYFLHEPTGYAAYPYPHPLVSGEEPTYYYLNITSTTGGSTTPTAGVHEYPSGTNVSVTATPDAGYTFSNWTLDGGDGGTDNPTYVYMDGNHTLTANFIAAPSIGEFQSPSTVYANKYFLLNATINDGDGIADFVNATVELSNGVILKWNNTTDTFSEYSDANGYCTLDPANSFKTQLNSTAYRLSWKIKLGWAYPEGSVDVLAGNTKVYDSGGASGSGSTTGLFTFEDDLIVASANVDDSRVNPGDAVTFTGTIFYQGTTTTPEDVTGITVKVELDGMEKGSDTDPTGGAYTITVNAESAVGSWSYNIYVVTDENSVQNQTVNVVADALNVTSCTVDLENELVYVNVAYCYYGSAVEGANVSYAGLYSATNSTGWATFSTADLTNVAFNSTATAIGDSAYGITTVIQNQTVAYEKEYVNPFTVKAEAPITNTTWNDIERILAFNSTGTVKVDVGDWGIPLRVEVNGEVYTDWSYDEAKHRLTINNLASHVELVWETEPEETPGSPPGPSEPPSPPPDEEEPPPFIPPITPTPMPDSTLISFGVVVIVFIVVGVFAYKELEYRNNVKSGWKRRQKQAKQSVKWRKSKRFG